LLRAMDVFRGSMAENRSHLHPSTAFVIVVPTAAVCDAKVLRWRRWASEAATLNIDFHLLADGPMANLTRRFAGVETVRLHQIAKESTILERYPGMQWGETQSSGTPGTPESMKLRERGCSSHRARQGPEPPHDI
jgi:hypothetical protein